MNTKLKINDEYDEVQLISFEKIKNLNYYTGFAYDGITDNIINTCLNKPDWLNLCNLNIEWQDDNTLMHTKQIPEQYKHASRVAVLIKAIEAGNGITPVTFDTIGVNYIIDGNHRIRALQFLDFKYFPAYCSGDMDEIKKMIY